MSSGRVLIAALTEEEQDAYFQKAKLKKLTPNTVTSKVKLRSLVEEARVKGWSIVDQELEIGLAFDLGPRARSRPAQVVAALNVACPSSRHHARGYALDASCSNCRPPSQAITAGLQ